MFSFKFVSHLQTAVQRGAGLLSGPLLIVLFLYRGGVILAVSVSSSCISLSEVFSLLTSSVITITCSVKMPSLLQPNYHQPLPLSLHNGCQETLKAPVQKLAFDPQPPY